MEWIREVRHSDVRALYEWRNDPEARRQSFNTDVIPWEKHLEWFENVLRSPKMHRIYIAFEPDTGVPVGSIRLTRDFAGVVVSFAVDAAHRRKGYATRMLEWVKSKAACEFPREPKLIAYVRINNVASRNALVRAGFVSLDAETLDDDQNDFLVYWCPNKIVS